MSKQPNSDSSPYEWRNAYFESVDDVVKFLNKLIEIDFRVTGNLMDGYDIFYRSRTEVKL